MSMGDIRPSFLVIGAAKAATTALSAMLAQHPEAGIVRGKEPHFFALDKVYARGWDWYRAQYAHCAGKRVLGDASTSNSRIRYFPEAVPRILRDIGKVRIIYMVRHPLERMVSAYVERLGSPGPANVFASINEAVRRQPMIIDSSRYWEVYDHYRQHFGEDRIHIVWFDEFIQANERVFADVCRFLGIDDQIVVDLPEEQKNSRHSALARAVDMGRGDIEVQTAWTDETRAWVLAQIGDDNRRFLDHFERPTDYWGPLFD